ncbi:MAG: VWA domain-containing protein [Myxococcales bacterium]|nr:VWA domain-containing protein [Myxococcales bacterium]
MRFAHPEVLSLLALVPLMLLGAWLLRRRSRRRLERLLPAAEQRAALRTARPGGVALRQALQALAVTFLVIAAARPQFGFDYVEVQRRGIDIVLAIDVSVSMLARDAMPDRLGQAKVIAGRLLDAIGSDRVAVLPFAGSSVLRWPLSFDHGAAKMLIDALDAQAVGRSGTGLKTAVEGALKLFTADEQFEKVLIILSDGEDHAGGIEEAARQAEKQKLIIHTIGIGGAHGVPIPLHDGKEENFKRDRSGNIVYTRLEPEPLQILSAVTGGQFVPASYGGEDVQKIAGTLAAMKGRDLKSSTVVRYKEQYQWFLLPAVALLAAESLLGRRKRRQG